jgi:hypothetical protein
MSNLNPSQGGSYIKSKDKLTRVAGTEQKKQPIKARDVPVKEDKPND